jgi:hypothetical protein
MVLTGATGSLLLVPAYHKFGRRPIMLASLVAVGHSLGLVMLITMDDI